MARRLFERQGVRRRAGSLASGVEFVVYSDEAGSTPADISASSGGGSIAGSTITTGDIAGLGPDALRFWGPPAGADTLYLRAPGDASLGVQKIEAATDPRLDALESGSASGIAATIFDAKGDLIAATAADTAARLAVGSNGSELVADSSAATGLKWMAPPVLNVKAPPFNAVGNNITDDTAAIQAAIDAAAALADGFGVGVPVVYFPPGRYSITSTINWKGCSLIGAGQIIGVWLQWNGTAGGTMFTKSDPNPPQGIMSGFTLTNGTTEPATFLDFTATHVDAMLRLDGVQFSWCTGDAIKVGIWVNLHWRNLRFDNIGRYAISAVPASGQFLSSFLIDGFTYDHSRPSGNGRGVIWIDNTANFSNLGTIALENGRIEVNTAWTSAKAVIVLTVPSVAPNNATAGIRLENITYQDVVGHAGDVLFFYDTGVAGGLVPTLILDNVRQSGLSALLGGGVDPGCTPPLLNNYEYLAIGYSKYVQNGGLFVDTYPNPTVTFKHSGTTVAAQSSDNIGAYYIDFNGNDGGGDLLFRSGSALTARARLKSADGGLVHTAYEEFPEIADPAAPAANHGRLYVKDNGAGKSQLVVRFPTGAVQILATEP